jgi:hypothetical protein
MVRGGSHTPSTSNQQQQQQQQRQHQQQREISIQKSFEQDCKKFYEAVAINDIKTARSIYSKYVPHSSSSQSPSKTTFVQAAQAVQQVRSLLTYRHLWMDRCKFTPLHIAVHENHWEVLEFMVGTGFALVDVANDVS